jgi:hypothetical protein
VLGRIVVRAIKTCIVVVTISVGLLFVADRAADPSTEMPPEKRQELHNDVHVIAARWRPFIKAIQSEMEKRRARIGRSS